MTWKYRFVAVTLACGLTVPLAADDSAGRFLAVVDQPASGEHALAASPTLTQPTIAGQWENDSIINPSRTDRWYTNGMSLIVGAQLRDAESLVREIPFGEPFDGSRAAIGISSGQLMFTPDDLDARQLIVDDRPYAGYLYGGVFMQRATDDVFDHMEIQLGVIGAGSLADDTQITIHDFFHAADPNGWKHQLGEEIGGDVIFKRKVRAAEWDLGDQIVADLIPQFGFTLGTVHRQLGAGATMRVGYKLPKDFGVGRIGDVADITLGSLPDTYAYLFGHVGGNFVIHNAFLDGGQFTDGHSVTRKPIVGLAQFGFAAQMNGWRVGYSVTVQSEEFEEQPEWHSWGSMFLSWTHYID